MSLDHKKQIIRVFGDTIIDVYKILAGNNAKIVPAMIF